MLLHEPCEPTCGAGVVDVLRLCSHTAEVNGCLLCPMVAWMVRLKRCWVGPLFAG
jgi:hypothetical protein